MTISLRRNDYWKTWAFDQNLRIAEAEPKIRTDFPLNRNLVLEEGLETLLLLNLDRVFPDWKLRLVGNIDANFRATDIEAADPAGVQHIFELKYKREAGTDKIGSQTLSYALERIGHYNAEWFDEAHAAIGRGLLASRIAAFWSGIRSQAHTESFSHLPQAEALARKFENIVSQHNQDMGEDLALNPATILESAEGHFKHLNSAVEGKRAQWPRRLSDIHLHLVMPKADRIDDEELEFLSRLRKQGLRLDLWEVRLSLTREDGTGTLGLREVSFPEDSKRSFGALGDRRLSQLLAEMAHQDLPLHTSTPTWRLSGDSLELTVELPIDGEPCSGPRFRIRVSDKTIQFEPSLDVPKHIKSEYSLTDLRTKILPTTMGAIRSWIADVFPPDEEKFPKESRQLHDCIHQTKEWEGLLPKGTRIAQIQASAKHYGSFQKACLTLDLSNSSPSFEALAGLANALFDSFLRHLIAEGAHPVGWTIPHTPR